MIFKSSNIQKIKKVIRALDYLTVTQIYLKDNFLLKEKLTFDHIKPRLLGHWGTCPGVNFIYAHLNNFIMTKRVNMIFLLGPGHGFPALQANVFLDGTLGKYYKEANRDEKGIEYIVKNFSWPYGFPSHASPQTPGVILEGGELGYSLSTAYGAVLDNPDLIAVPIIGDGEAETGPLATSWHLHRLLNKQRDGKVLPILHLNGYKISGPTFFGRMKDKELLSLFKGYGFDKIYILDAVSEKNDDKIHKNMINILDKCHKDIKSFKNPMIIFKSKKGWGGIKELHGQKYENNYLSHQVIAKDAKTNDIDLKALENWLKSYRFDELFDTDKGFDKDILSQISDDLSMSNNPIAFAKKSKDLLLNNTIDFLIDIDTNKRGILKQSSMISIGYYLRDVFNKNLSNNNFRLMSPDETYSNKLDEVFNSTNRVWSGEIYKTDKNMSDDGRVMEMLSEHALHGLLQGYILTGRHGVLASYEAFMQIVASMADQYSKFLKIAKDISWRGDLSSMNYILTSSLWRQEHNGFSHQNPGFIDTLLQKHNNFVNVYFPADSNTSVLYINKCLSSKNKINAIVAEKTNEAVWLNKDESLKQVKDGIMIWDFASDENPDIVFVASGQYQVKEMLKAIKIIKEETSSVKIRLVYISELSPYTLGNYEDKMPQSDFEKYFTKDKKVIFNFHGYPETLKQILFDYENDYNRFSVHGYIDIGSTTTAFDLQIRNHTSAYDIAIEAWRKLSIGEKSIKKYLEKINENKSYVITHGKDTDEIENWSWNS